VSLKRDWKHYAYAGFWRASKECCVDFDGGLLAEQQVPVVVVVVVMVVVVVVAKLHFNLVYSIQV